MFRDVFLPLTVNMKRKWFTVKLQCLNIFGTMEIVLDMGSSSHRGLIMQTGRETNKNN